MPNRPRSLHRAHQNSHPDTTRSTIFILNKGYWAWRAKNGLGDVGESPDNVLAQMAWAANKSIHSEFPTYPDATRWYATLSEEAARERLEELLDSIDDERAGLHSDRE
jgi:hypothetical protein